MHSYQGLANKKAQSLENKNTNWVVKITNHESIWKQRLQPSWKFEVFYVPYQNKATRFFHSKMKNKKCPKRKDDEREDITA